MRAPKKYAQGSVLVFSLLILSILLVTSLTILSSSLLDRKASLSTGSTAKSFQVADSGVEEVLFQIYKKDHPTLEDLGDAVAGGSASIQRCEVNSNGVPQIQFPSAGGEVTVSFYRDDDNPYTGGCGSPDWRSAVTRIKSEGASGTTARAISAPVSMCPSVVSTRPLMKPTTADGPVEERSGEGGIVSEIFAGKYMLVGSREQGCNYPGNGGDGPATPEDNKNAYVGLYVFDVSNPLIPTEVGFLPTSWNSDGSVADASSAIYGYSNYGQPSKSICQNPTDIKIRGDYAYVSTDVGSFIIVDLSDYTQGRVSPQPSLVYRPEREHGAEMYMRRYLFSFNQGLYGAWHIASTYAVDLDAGGNNLFVSTQGGINIYDVRNPSNTKEVNNVTDFKEFSSGGPLIHGIRLSTPYLQRGGVTDLMVDPANPNILYVIYKVTGYNPGKDSSGNDLVSADDRKSWIGAYDITDKSNIVQVGKYIVGSEAEDPYRFVKRGDYLYVTQWQTPALVTLQVSVSGGSSVAFSKVDEQPLPSDGYDIQLNGDELFVTGSDFIDTFDISGSNDNSPSRTGTISAPINGKSTLGIDGALYLADEGGLKALCR